MIYELQTSEDDLRQLSVNCAISVETKQRIFHHFWATTTVYSEDLTLTSSDILIKMRRARVKLAPNLGVVRNRNIAPTPKVVIKSDTENSESETNPSDSEDTKVAEKKHNIVENLSSQSTSAPVVNRSNDNVVPENESFKPVEITPLVTANNDVASAVETTVGDLVTNGHHSEEVTSPVIAGEVKTAPAKVRLPAARTKFRPNLNFDRARHGSGPGVTSNGAVSPRPRPALPNTRARTISSSSTNSETEAAVTSSHPLPTPATNLRDSPILRAAITSPRPARIRRTTESSRSTIGDRSQFLRRKQDHKKKFSSGIPERGNLTMFDLIYYNPTNGKRMSVEDDPEEERVDDPENDLEVATINGKIEVIDDPVVEDTEPKSEAIPVPQVKVGANGEIIIDESSLQVETTQSKVAKEVLKNASLVFENGKTSNNYGRWSKKRRHNDWSQKETIKFYRALSVVGSDFSLMESVFKNKRTRQELKLKFKKEERINTKMVDKCLRERGMFTDLESLMRDTEEDEDDDVEADEDFGRSRGRKPKKVKKRPRKRYKNRGYYESSSDGEDADVEASKSPVGRKVAKKSQPDQSEVVRIIEPPSQEASIVTIDQSEQRIVSIHQPQASVQFPPGLLAANPSLAGAKPGSLVVVASPHKPDNPHLHVYMVPDTKQPIAQKSPRPVTPQQVPSLPSDSLRLDPAVVRAVDRGRLHRQRTMSECEAASRSSLTGRKRTLSERDDCTAPVAPVLGKRSRTISESGLDSVHDSGSSRQRFLSGSTK